MATEDIQGKGLRFGEGQPTNLGGRPRKQPLVEIIEEWLQDEGFIEFEPKDIKLLPNGNYKVQMPNHQMIATKFMQMVMKPDIRFMDMFFKLTGEYQAVKHDIAINENPLGGKNFDRLSDEDRKILLSLGEKV
jgi:hypothetical protein